jgi:predicted alpha/beta superfamily hydrolase
MEFDSWVFTSKNAGGNYKIYIHLPAGYDTTKTSYPVLYLTDGDWNMTVATTCINMLRQDYILNEPILVGIGYGEEKNNRSYDLNPDAGGEAFYQFISKELMPVINKRYRTNHDDALYGHSFGGYFTNFVLFNHTETFDKYLIGAIPVWYKFPRTPTKEAKNYFQSHDSLRVEIFMGVGSFEGTTVKEMEAFESYLKKLNYRGATLEMRITPNAGHGGGITQIMEDAISISYCKKHKPLLISKANLRRFVGNYVYEKDSGNVAHIYIQNDKLYFQDPYYLSELKPFKEKSFFIPVNEYVDIIFKDDQMAILFPGDPDRIYYKKKKK